MTGSTWWILSTGAWKYLNIRAQRSHSEEADSEEGSPPRSLLRHVVGSELRVRAAQWRPTGYSRPDAHRRIAGEGRPCEFVLLLPCPAWFDVKSDSPLEPAAFDADLRSVHLASLQPEDAFGGLTEYQYAAIREPA